MAAALRPEVGLVKTGAGEPISAIAVAHDNSDIIWVGHKNGDVYMTTKGTDDTPAWNKVDEAGSVPLPDRYCTRITIDQTNP